MSHPNGIEPVPDMSRALARLVKRYHDIPQEERDANLRRERAIRARLARRSNARQAA